MMPFGGPELLFVLIYQVAILGLVVLGIVWIVRRLSGDSPQGHGNPSALDELARRYARGEIDRPTYLQMLDDLSRHPRA